jgi:hypothetical protein
VEVRPMKRFGPKVYRSMDEFQREEIAPHMKAGFCLDDLYADATYNAARDDSFDDDTRELDFDF